MTDRWRITVDRELCKGTALCVGSAPGRFALDAEHRSAPLTGQVDPDDTVLFAAECCPMEAITVTDVATGRRLFPL